MVKQNNTWVIVVILLLVLFLLPKYGLYFIITGAETITREYTLVVDAGANPGIKYKVSGASGDWAASIVDTLKCPGSPDITRKVVIISDAGTSLIVTGYQMPNENGITCILEGDYMFGDKPIKSFQTQVIKTRSCNTEADVDCDGIISRSELGLYISKWLGNQITRTKLGETIQAWAGQ